MVENFGSLYRKLLKVIFPKSNGNLENNDKGGSNTQVNVIIDQFNLEPDEFENPIGSRILIRFRILSMNGSIKILKIIDPFPFEDQPIVDEDTLYFRLPYNTNLHIDNSFLMNNETHYALIDPNWIDEEIRERISKRIEYVIIHNRDWGEIETTLRPLLMFEYVETGEINIKPIGEKIIRIG